jgi:hypothetical protein
MEVHAHTHTPRKKWTHYFWEFLMLFLAVFCGFLAEYQLEHKIEKDREKQYVRSLVNDIKSDIAQLEFIDTDWKESLNAADSLLYYLAGKEILKNSYPAYRLIGPSTGFTDFIASDGTIQQLKNSGGLRLLRKRNVVDSIMFYQKTVDRIIIKQTGMNDQQLNDGIIQNLFDAVLIHNAVGKSNIPLLISDKKAINPAYNYIRSWRAEFSGLRKRGSISLECGKRLLITIQKEYEID